ncbi:MAG: hypothetical protein KC897_08715 [Candidatus Omnitrophica bacterium]|nr:hypothetical protein [Candidatus Omnitrophota bacterium]MCB9721608.1 hypothetical protein [Candidatus Omnitrophota bacterium]
MSNVSVTHLNKDDFEVTVREGTTTRHIVTVTDAYHQRLTEGRLSKEELLIKSFAFLLDRESNTMILGRFELPVIQRYFPEYEGTIG